MHWLNRKMQGERPHCEDEELSYIKPCANLGKIVVIILWMGAIFSMDNETLEYRFLFYVLLSITCETRFPKTNKIKIKYCKWYKFDESHVKGFYKMNKIKNKKFKTSS